MQPVVEVPSSPSLTDTLSASTSSSLESDTSDAGCKKNNPVVDSTHSQNVNMLIFSTLLFLQAYFYSEHIKSEG